MTQQPRQLDEKQKAQVAELDAQIKELEAKNHDKAEDAAERELRQVERELLKARVKRDLLTIGPEVNHFDILWLERRGAFHERKRR